MEVTDDMVQRALDAFSPDMARIAPHMGGWSDGEKARMRVALEAALAVPNTKPEPGR